MATIAVRSKGENWVTVRVSGMSSGVATINLYYRKSSASANTHDATYNKSGFSVSSGTYYCDHTFEGLSAGTTYTFTVNYYNESGTRVDQNTCTETTDAVIVSPTS